MAEFWSQQIVEAGNEVYLRLDNGTSPGTAFGAGGVRAATWRFVNVTIPQGATILSATLTVRKTSAGWRHTLDWGTFNVDDVPYLSDGNGHLHARTFGATQQVDLDGLNTYDVTDPIQTVIDRVGWEPGNALGVLAMNESLSQGEITFAQYPHADRGTLTVEWEPNVQELDPVTTFVPAYVGAVEPSYSITPATVGVPVTVGRVDIIAPRSLTAATAFVPVTVGATVTRGTGPAPPLNVAHALLVGVSVGVPTLAREIRPEPDPPPWQRLITTPAYHAALASREQTTDARIDILNPDGALIATLGGTERDGATHYPGVVAGDVSCDAGAQVRWTCDLTIDNADLVPTSPRDLLHPLAYNQALIWHRIWIPSLGQWGEVPVGAYYLDYPQITDTSAGDLGITVAGSDVVALIKAATYRHSIEVGGMYAHDAIRTILQDRAPWARASLQPATHRLPADWEAGEPGSDPVDDITEIAQAAGMVFYANRVGVLILEPAPGVGSAPAAEFIEGPGAAMTEINATVDLDRLLNAVTVAGTATTDADGNDIEPVVATVVDDDPTSPLYIDAHGGRERHQRFEFDDITTAAKARDMAQQILDDHRALVDQVEITAFTQAHLDPGDVVDVSTDRAAISGRRQIGSWTMALGGLSGMRIATTGRKGLT